MSEELVRQDKAPVVTPEQVVLIRQTVARGATDEELKLFFYDCARRGVHPLDRLIHFTKRKNRREGTETYTPITSIDFMRTRAAESGEYAGNEDAIFAGDIRGENFTATVTVHRMVQGVVGSFTATARWSEYKPPDDFMWIKMPHTMLGKCAEALALRKAFPQQLAGLYAKEEMDQASFPTSDVKPRPLQEPQKKTSPPPPSPVADGNTIKTPIYDVATKEGKGTKGPWCKYIISGVGHDGNEVQFSTFDKKLGDLAVKERGTGMLFEVQYERGQYGNTVKSMVPLEAPPPTQQEDVPF